MKRPTSASLALAATLLAILVPAAGAPAALVPPGNSAVTQYTESLPTPGGHKDTDKGNKKRQRSPEEALGARNARQLEAQGPGGRAAAADPRDRPLGARLLAAAEATGQLGTWGSAPR